MVKVLGDSGNFAGKTEGPSTGAPGTRCRELLSYLGQGPLGREPLTMLSNLGMLH